MKKWVYLFLALIMSVGILVYVSADVNHGHGPGYVAEESAEGHGEAHHEEEGQH